MEKYFSIDKKSRNKNLEYSCLLEAILPNSEIEEKRTIEEYKKWVIEKNRLLNEAAAGNNGFKFFMRPYGHKMAKKFYEEIKFLAAFLQMQNFLSNSCLVQISLRDTKYDARILYKNDVIFYIELTVIYKDEQEIWGSNILNQQGYVDPRIEIKKMPAEGGKAGYKLLCDDSKTSLVVDEISKIKKAIEKKINKIYPDKTLLVVGGACCLGYEDKDVLEIQRILRAAENNVFANIFFIDLLKNIFVAQKMGAGG